MKTILHIDDDKFLLELYGNIFREAGYNVISLEQVEKDFVAQIAKLKPEIIVSDVVKPPPNGLQLLRGIKADDRTKNIPFVFISNSIDPEVREISEEFGLHEPILKAGTPPHTVIATIEKILEKDRPRS